MHIVATLIGLAGTAVFVLWRIYLITHAARELTDAASDARGLFRRWRWRKKANVNPLDTITDAREAAAAMVVAVAQCDGPLTERETEAIHGVFMKTFGSTSAQADELLSYGRWLVRDVVDTAEIFRRTAPLVERTCTAEQKRELIAMLTTVAEAG